MRDKLIAAAADALEAEGVDGLTVRDVARRAEQSTIGIYRHFSGKDGLLDALFQRGFARFGSTAQAAGEREISPRDAILATVAEYLALATGQPQHYRLMFAPDSAGFTPSDAAREQMLANYASFVTLVERLPIHKHDARRAANDMFALVHGHVALQMQGYGPAIEPQKWSARILASVARQIYLLEDMVED